MLWCQAGSFLQGEPSIETAGTGNTGVKCRCQCPGFNFYKGPFLCLHPGLSLEVSQASCEVVGTEKPSVSVTLAKKQVRSVRNAVSHCRTFHSKQEILP